VGVLERARDVPRHLAQHSRRWAATDDNDRRSDININEPVYDDDHIAIYVHDDYIIDFDKLNDDDDGSHFGFTMRKRRESEPAPEGGGVRVREPDVE